MQQGSLDRRILSVNWQFLQTCYNLSNYSHCQERTTGLDIPWMLSKVRKVRSSIKQPQNSYKNYHKAAIKQKIHPYAPKSLTTPLLSSLHHPPTLLAHRLIDAFIRNAIPQTFSTRNPNKFFISFYSQKNRELSKIHIKAFKSHVESINIYKFFWAIVQKHKTEREKNGNFIAYVHHQ